MATDYPDALDDAPGTHADVWDAVAAVQATLGTNPEGNYATVEERLTDGTADVDLSEIEAELDLKAPTVHAHDIDYYPRAETTGMFVWYVGDAAPSWVGGARPTGITAMIVLNTEAEKPAWAEPLDFVFIRPVTNVPEIRVFGPFTAHTTDQADLDIVVPDTAQVGDSLWIMASTNVTSVTPSGWTLVVPEVLAGSNNSLVIYEKTCVLADIGSTVVVDYATNTAAAGVCFAWEGEVEVDTYTSSTQTTVSNTQTFPGLTPTEDSTVIGLVGIRYNIVAGAEGVGVRTGWTTQFNGASAKAGAPNRGLHVTQYLAGGAPSVLVPGSNAGVPVDATFINYVISVVKV